ncbi:TrmH family RNA methyltransferase [Candidatus Nomurabacteria bacterium]|uniref:TrmH family RNA methyltransferase n=1 Tax=Candidatus Dojkabacteria bacterium TaxID=2099670 RepID=A0A955I3E3_9BACT|nr:TrmH family RNA methyltransferase [Candidatus Dojkabacteria bacterium]MCB9789559.1 TrmH family RNA methyltransferase [Candidatus Nomurabacteria bacterium]MCB9803964.1 TrmH family RNA methyltransferase [Candidatus Nomurabacteria bacterium]
MNRYDPKLKPYIKKLDYSYTFGTYPTLDLLKLKPDRVLKVLLKPDSEKSDGVLEIKRICEEKNIPCEINERAIDKIAYKENTYALGIFQKYKTFLDILGDHIVLVEPRNMGNIGTIIRTMVGLGFKDLAIIGDSADLFDPKVVRSAMGALFRINFNSYPTFTDYQKKFSQHTLYPFILENGRDIRQVAVDSPYTLIFGNEAKGLMGEFANIGEPVYIPQHIGVDSLNLSIAAGIAMWHFASISRKLAH